MDRETFRIVYEEHYLKMLKYARTMVKDLDTAHDIVIDVFLAWHKHSDEVKYEEAWLVRCTGNLCISYLRKVKYRREIEQSLDFDEYEEFEPFKDEIIKAQVFYLLEKEVDKLPQQAKDVFRLHLSGLDTAKIASTLNIALQTVRNQRNIAIHKLKKVAYKYC